MSPDAEPDVACSPDPSAEYGQPRHLTQCFPKLSPEQLLAGFVPPPHFAHARFDTYIADPQQPSQAEAVQVLKGFAQGLHTTQSSRWRGLRRDRDSAAKVRVSKSVRSGRSSSRRGARTDSRPGVYLDGGFGVGKTHLLAALWYATADAGERAFGTFVEYTNLVGALGFEQTVAALSRYHLVCIDEFELDDPGDTVLMSSLLTRLVENGVKLAATSNTLPDRLGEGRFAAEDFIREIQNLAASFLVCRIDGEDYRHRGLAVAPLPLTGQQVIDAAFAMPSKSSLDSFGALMEHLISVHPSRYGALVAGLDRVCLSDLGTLDDQASALRFVVLVDRMYDRDVSLFASGIRVDEVFTDEMLAGGYRKKYRRAISRLDAMAVSGL